MDGWAVGRFGPGPDVITLTSLTYVRTLEPTVALGKGENLGYRFRISLTYNLLTIELVKLTV